MNDVLMREIKQSHIPQDVQVAIDTLLSWGYTVNLENQILRERLDEVRRLLNDREIEEAIVATHKGTVSSESARIRELVNGDMNPSMANEGGAE